MKQIILHTYGIPNSRIYQMKIGLNSIHTTSLCVFVFFFRFSTNSQAKINFYFYTHFLLYYACVCARVCFMNSHIYFHVNDANLRTI